MSAAPVLKYSFEDYLEIESAGEKRYEFYDGELFEVENASIAHNKMLANTFGELSSFLKNKECSAFTSQLKVHVKSNSLTSYPDISIVCGAIETLKGHKDIVTNPSVIIEIVSPSTGDYDHGKKFQLYRAIPSLKEYILLSSMEILVEKFSRQENGFWILHEYNSLEQSFLIDSIGLQLSLADIYHRISFD